MGGRPGLWPASGSLRAPTLAQRHPSPTAPAGLGHRGAALPGDASHPHGGHHLLDGALRQRRWRQCAAAARGLGGAAEHAGLHAARPSPPACPPPPAAPRRSASSARPGASSTCEPGPCRLCKPQRRPCPCQHAASNSSAHTMRLCLPHPSPTHAPLTACASASPTPRPTHPPSHPPPPRSLLMYFLSLTFFTFFGQALVFATPNQVGPGEGCWRGRRALARPAGSAVALVSAAPAQLRLIHRSLRPPHAPRSCWPSCCPASSTSSSRSSRDSCEGAAGCACRLRPLPLGCWPRSAVQRCLQLASLHLRLSPSRPPACPPT